MIHNVKIPSKSIEFGAKIDSECKKRWKYQENDQKKKNNEKL